jgi:chorismate lyase / 3-hydroxybenzoate synthase
VRIGTPVTASALKVRRISLAGISGQVVDGRPPLGALGYGGRADAAWSSGVTAPLLLLDQAGTVGDLWLAGDRIDSGRSGGVHWRSDGHWVFGSIDLDEDSGGLEQLARSGYRDLFQALQDTGCPHLLRIWNYLPRINDDGGGLERYRQFNLGRQQAFIDAGHAIYEGSPAACALGVQRGALGIRFLAGRCAPLAIENPRQVSAYRYPSAYGPRPPTFSRAALADIGGGQLGLFISGTASIVGHATVHAGDIAEQTRETLRNLGAVIAAANERCSAQFGLDALDAVVYVRHPSHAPLVRQLLEDVLGSAAPTLQSAVYLEADICRHDLLVEIEAHAIAPGVLRQ